MKIYCLALLSFSLLLTSCVASRYAVDDQIYSQTDVLKITRTFYAQDGDAIFRAYVVQWEGHEVPMMSWEQHAEGNVVEVRVSNRPYPRGAAPHRLLSFRFAQPMSARLAPAIDPQWAKEAGERARKDRRVADLEVLEVFSVTQGQAVFRAYRVRWKGQDVVVNDSLANQPRKRGDTISVEIGKAEFPPGREPIGQDPHRRLTFSMAPVEFWESEQNPLGISTRAP